MGNKLKSSPQLASLPLTIPSELLPVLNTAVLAPHDSYDPESQLPLQSRLDKSQNPKKQSSPMKLQYTRDQKQYQYLFEYVQKGDKKDQVKSFKQFTGYARISVIERQQGKGEVVFEGEFVKGKRQGYGIEYDLQTRLIQVYQGEFKDNKYHGRGRTQYYEGDFKRGVKDGWGVFCYGGKGLDIEEGYEIRYEGEWKNDKFEGIGLLNVMPKDAEKVISVVDYNIKLNYAKQTIEGLKQKKKDLEEEESKKKDLQKDQNKTKEQKDKVEEQIGEIRRKALHFQTRMDQLEKEVGYEASWRKINNQSIELFDRLKKRQEVDCMYIGSWEKGERNGLGLLITSEEQYFGQFLKGCKQGDGELKIKKSKLEGIFYQDEFKRKLQRK